MKRKGYAIVRISIQREVEVDLDDEVEVDQQALVEKAVGEKFNFGELQLDTDDPDEVEIIECDYAD